MHIRTTMLSHWLLYLLACLLFSTAVDAKSVIVALCWDDEMTLTYPGSESPTDDLFIPYRDRSRIMEYEGPSNFYFSKRVTGVDGKETFEPVAQVALPTTTNRVLILLVPNQSNSTENLPYRSIIIDDSYTKFPARSVRLLNLTSREFQGKLMETSFNIGKQQEKIISADNAPDFPKTFPLLLSEFMEDANRWRLVKSTGLALGPSTRAMILLLDDPKNPRGIRTLTLRDQVYLKEEETSS